MITRRQAISGASSALVLSVAARAGESARPETAPDTLFALSGKKPLIRRTFRPPNLETPLADSIPGKVKGSVAIAENHGYIARSFAWSSVQPAAQSSVAV